MITILNQEHTELEYPIDSPEDRNNRNIVSKLRKSGEAIFIPELRSIILGEKTYSNVLRWWQSKFDSDGKKNK